VRLSGTFWLRNRICEGFGSSELHETRNRKFKVETKTNPERDVGHLGFVFLNPEREVGHLGIKKELHSGAAPFGS
jgi:hypothetical protein